MKLDNKLLRVFAVLLLAIPLIYSVDAEAVSGQLYNGDGAPQIISGSTNPFVPWQWNVQVAHSFSSCLSCHGGNLNNPISKSSYLLTGHKNMLRAVQTPVVAHGGPDGTPYDQDLNGNFFNWLQPTPSNTITLGVCTVAGETTQADCENAGGTWSRGSTTKDLFYIFNGWMSPEVSGTPNTSSVAPGSVYDGSSYGCGRCHTTGFTMDTTVNTSRPPELHFPGINSKVNFDPDNALPPAAPGPATTSSWAVAVTGVQTMEGVQCERCHDATNHFTTGTTRPRGTDATALCLQCHRQDHVLPYVGGGLGANIVPTAYTDNGTLPANEPLYALPAIEVGGYRGYERGFYNYSTGMEFLNSAHARFGGNFQQIADSTQYSSSFQETLYTCSKPLWYLNQSTCQSNGGTWSQSTVQGGCTTCHDVHNSLFVQSQVQAAIKRTCENCHVNNPTSGAPQVSLTYINHHTGANTPFDTTKYSDSCVVCHMATQAVANGNQNSTALHLWRINSNASYNTLPTIGQFYGGTCSVHTGAVQNAPYIPVVYLSDTSSTNCGAASGTWSAVAENRTATTTTDDKGFTGAVWVDLQFACGQCHGGGTNPAANPPIGSIPWESTATLAARANGIHHAIPDLAVLSLLVTNDAAKTQPTTTTSAGSTVYITDITVNVGGGASVATTTAFYLSTTTGLPGTAKFACSDSIPALAGGASNPATTTTCIVPAIAAGTYYIVANADDTNTSGETNKANNTRAFGPVSVVANNVDLVVSASSYAPAGAKRGTSINVIDITMNLLSGTAGASQTGIYLLPSCPAASATPPAIGSQIGTRSIASIAGGSSNSGTTSVTIPASTPVGVNYIVFYADWQNTVAETNELNNARCRAISITP